jgi:hypothetical protein
VRFVRAFARKRALQRYAHELAARLHRDYGASEFYTPGQIRSAVARLRLSPELVTHGYAMFLPAETFNAMATEVRGALSYDEARAEVARYTKRAAPASGGFSAIHGGGDWSGAGGGYLDTSHGAGGDAGGGHGGGGA